jgi:hypothetical protein
MQTINRLQQINEGLAWLGVKTPTTRVLRRQTNFQRALRGGTLYFPDDLAQGNAREGAAGCARAAERARAAAAVSNRDAGNQAVLDSRFSAARDCAAFVAPQVNFWIVSA